MTDFIDTVLIFIGQLDLAIFLSSIAIFLSSIAIIVSWYIAKRKRDDDQGAAKRRATFDMLSDTSKYEVLYDNFKSSMNAYSRLGDRISSHERKNIHHFINHYEFIAGACFAHILDEEFYKSQMKSTYIRHYKQAEPFILELRETSPMAYTQFEELAMKWDNGE